MKTTVLALVVLAGGCASPAPQAALPDATGSASGPAASGPVASGPSDPLASAPHPADPTPSVTSATPGVASAEPGSSAAPPEVADAKVSVTKGGKVLLDGAHVADDRELTAKVKLLVARAPGLRVVIQADKDLPYARVVTILDALKAAGVTRVAVAVAPGG